MIRQIEMAFVISAVLVPLASSAQAGPCTKDIRQFERAVRQSAANAGAGPTAPQSIGAQLGHQPTPRSVEGAAVKARRTFISALRRAEMLDAKGERKCVQALAYAKRLYDLQ
jgi:hypothetical protein